MSHLHKGRLAQVNDQVSDLTGAKERCPIETAKALAAAQEKSSAEIVAKSVPKKRGRK